MAYIFAIFVQIVYIKEKEENAFCSKKHQVEKLGNLDALYNLKIQVGNFLWNNSRRRVMLFLNYQKVLTIGFEDRKDM